MIVLSIIIPVFNSQHSLVELSKKIQSKLKHKHEIIFINDESKDKSWSVIKDLSSKYENILGINLLKNVGQDNAIMAGLSFAKGEFIIIMDDDLQHDPSYIIDLYDKCEEGYDVVYGNFIKKKQKLWKNFGSWLNGKFASFFIKKPKDVIISPYKIIRKNIVEQMINYKSPFTYIDGIIFSLTSNVKQINIQHFERTGGKSNYNFYNSFSIFINHITSYSILPLRFVTIIGLLLSVIAGILSIFWIINYLNNVTPEGWTSLMLVVLFIGGMTLFSLGIIGEYIGRLYLLSSNKPQYVIKEITK